MSSIPWQQTIFMPLDQARALLGCSFPEIDDYIKSGRIRVSMSPYHPQRGKGRRVFTVDVAALFQEQQAKNANFTLGEHPGCGACLQICAVCKRVEQRSSSYDLLTEEEATYILGCTRSELIGYVRAKKIGVHKSNTKFRFWFRDVKAFVAKQVLRGINVQEERRGIVNALGQMIELRYQEMAELDAELIRWSIGHEESHFRYGEVVDLAEPPSGFWYVYHLCHPSGRPFYVGKGIGNRMYQHEKEAIKGNGYNSYKCGVIRKLLKRGDQVRYRVVFITPDEAEAYQYEVQEIARLGGYKKLTNLTPGGFTREHHDQAFGSHVPREQRNYKQFLHQLSLYPAITPEQRGKYIRSWARDRIIELEKLRREAVGLSHSEAIQKIDAEIDSLQPFAAYQRSFADIMDRRRRYADAWDDDD